jgi:hypothetical protein
MRLLLCLLVLFARGSGGFSSSRSRSSGGSTAFSLESRGGASTPSLAPPTRVPNDDSPPPTVPLVSPDYVGVGPNVSFADALAILALAGLANRDAPMLWLNTSATPLFPTGPRPPHYPDGVAIDVWYPGADAVWRAYLAEKKGLGKFDVARDSRLCTLLGDARLATVPKGLVLYEASAELDGLQWAALTAAGLYDGLPVTAAMIARHRCLQALPTVFTLPGASSFRVDLDVYRWAVDALLPRTNKRIVVSACKSWKNYTCGWTLAPGVVSLDYAVSSKSFVLNLSPDEVKHPEQGAMTQQILKHLDTGGAMVGWSEPETVTVRYLAMSNSVVICGAPNLSFLASVAPGQSRALPYHRTPTAEKPAPLDRGKVYITFYEQRRRHRQKRVRLEGRQLDEPIEGQGSHELGHGAHFGRAVSCAARLLRRHGD